MKLRTQIILAFLIITKLVLGSIFMCRVGLDFTYMETAAIASELETDPENTAEEGINIAKEDKNDINVLNKKNFEFEEKRLTEQKAELVAIQAEINKKIEKLTQLRDEIRADIAKKKKVKELKLKHLVKVYSAMEPQSAAGLIEKLDIKLAIMLLAKMKGDNAGKILSFVNIEKAAKISEGIVKRD